MMAERVAEQVRSLRATDGRASDPVAVSFHDSLPVLLGESHGGTLVGIEHTTLSLFAVYGAYYFVTPIGVEPKDP